jgi:hypothetical protein
MVIKAPVNIDTCYDVKCGLRTARHTFFHLTVHVILVSLTLTVL